MKIITLTAWFIIKSHTPGVEHNYYLYEPEKRYHVSYITKDKLRFGADQWIKLKLKMECELVKTQAPTIHNAVYLVNNYYCTTNEVLEQKCTEYNSFVVNGIRYC